MKFFQTKLKADFDLLNEDFQNKVIQYIVVIKNEDIKLMKQAMMLNITLILLQNTFSKIKIFQIENKKSSLEFIKKLWINFALKRKINQI